MSKPGTAIVHLLTEHPEGKVRSLGLPQLDRPQVERTFAVACAPGSTLPKAATGESRAVTCPLCRKTQAFSDLEIAEQAGGSDADLAALKHIRDEQERSEGETMPGSPQVQAESEKVGTAPAPESPAVATITEATASGLTCC